MAKQAQRTSEETRQSADTRYAWGVCALLLVAIVIIYGQTLGHRLLDFDDNAFVQENPHVTAGLSWEGIRWAFADGPYGEWYPLAMLSHMLDCQLFGTDAWGHHLTNVLLHAATSIALFLVWRCYTDELWPSAFVAALFAVHPQHVESVAWVAERRDVLSGLFFVLTLGAWLGYVRHGRSRGRYFLVAVLFALGLMSKSILVTLPPLLLLLDFWPLARFGSASDAPNWTRGIERPGLSRLVLEKIPLLALAVGAGLMTLRTHSDSGATLAWPERFGNAAVSCVTYLFQFFCPLNLAAFYPFPPGGPPAWKVVGAIAILVVVSTAAVICRRRNAYCFVGWFWFLGMLLPVLGLVKIGWIAMADRYMYLPGVGLYVAVAWGGARLAAGSLPRRRLVGAGAVLAIVALMVCANQQTSVWSDDETLWRHALACTVDNGHAEGALATELSHQGRFDEAIDYFQQAKQHATDATPYINLGSLLAEQGKLDEAIHQFRQAAEVQPNSYWAHANLGAALAQRNELDEARKHFLRALEIDPLGVAAHSGLGRLLLRNRQAAEARNEFELAVQSDPRNVGARNDLASTLFELGEVDEAIEQLEAALAIDPNFPLGHVNLARLLAARGRRDQAITHYRRALELDPNNATARADLDRLLCGTAGPAAQ